MGVILNWWTRSIDGLEEKEAETEVILKVPANGLCVSWHRSPEGKLRCGRVWMRQEKTHILKCTTGIMTSKQAKRKRGRRARKL